jgi:hypothetical protein
MEIHAGQFEQHILDEDLDPWGYMEQQGFDPESAQSGKSGILGEESKEDSLTPDEMEQEIREATGGVGQEDKIDDLTELNEPEQDSDPKRQPEAPPEVEDPYEVRTGGHPKSSPKETEANSENNLESESDADEEVGVPESRDPTPRENEPNKSTETSPGDTQESDSVLEEKPSEEDGESNEKTNAELVKEKVENWVPLFEDERGGTEESSDETPTSDDDLTEKSEEKDDTSKSQNESDSRNLPIPSVESQTIRWALKTIPPILLVLGIGFYTLVL